MFSGKSEELLRRLRRASIARQAVQLFKPSLNRAKYGDEVISHDNTRMPSIAVAHSSEVLARVAPATVVVGIEEVQFFDPGIVNVCERLASDGRRVICAGLDQDYRGIPFDPVPHLLAVAEYVTKNLAVCMVCGAPANRSQRLVRNRDRVLVGSLETYEPRCRRCFVAPVELRDPLAQPALPALD